MGGLAAALHGFEPSLGTPYPLLDRMERLGWLRSGRAERPRKARRR